MITADLSGGYAVTPNPDAPPAGYAREHAHYFKDVSKLHEIDLYRVFDLFGVTHPCAQHAIKKLMVARKGNVKAMDKIEDSIDGKLVEKKVEIRTDSYAALMKEAAELAKAKYDNPSQN